jgi:hypothetical protein
MKPKFVVLGVKPIKGSYTGANMSEILSETLKEYNINREKIHTIVRDGESAMDLTVRLLGFDSQWCYAHILNLVYN